MRGIKVPLVKAQYILMDATREARREKIPFGRIVDPLGEATELAMAIGFKAIEEGSGETFFRPLLKAIWADGMDGTDTTKLKAILKNAGLSDTLLVEKLDKGDWQRRAEANRVEMLSAGSWGVPTLRVGLQTMWGQDRVWAITDALKKD